MPIMRAMFFDIGGTLGDVEAIGLKLALHSDSISILRAARSLGCRLGVITNVPEGVDKDRIRAMLAEAAIVDLFEDAGLITSTEAASFKPATAIYLFAANAMRLPVDQCAYVDVNPAQVTGAVVAGMQGILKRKAPLPSFAEGKEGGRERHGRVATS